MKIIIVDQQHGKTKTVILKGWMRGLLSLCLLGLPVTLGYYSYQYAESQDDNVYSHKAALTWAEQLKKQAQDVNNVKREAQEQLEALTLRMAELQARLVRLDALGERLTTAAKLDRGEFNFSQVPAVGGPDTGISEAYTAPQFIVDLEHLAEQISDREQQLEILQDLLGDRKIESDVFIAGRPISKGWISSRYGRRTDPFTGRLAWHEGVDFATGRIGADINTVASGVVTWASERSGYGLMTEVNHGGGYRTRYAHAEKLLVRVGDIVKKGQVIALMGNSGRSTGPHVHFEVYKNDRVVDPASYIHRVSR